MQRPMNEQAEALKQRTKRFALDVIALGRAFPTEESDESGYWLEVARDVALAPTTVVDPLLKEADELTAIFARSAMTARQSADRQSINRQ